MDVSMAVQIGQQALWISLLVSGPVLIVGLLVGLLIGVFQAVTQIHEMTLTFIPKILAMVGVFLVLLPWMLIQLMDYTVNLFSMIPSLIR
jgi:flagellar biosynthesis protein FliQ